MPAHRLRAARAPGRRSLPLLRASLPGELAALRAESRPIQNAAAAARAASNARSIAGPDTSGGYAVQLAVTVRMSV